MDSKMMVLFRDCNTFRLRVVLAWGFKSIGWWFWFSSSDSSEEFRIRRGPWANSRQNKFRYSFKNYSKKKLPLIIFGFLISNLTFLIINWILWWNEKYEPFYSLILNYFLKRCFWNFNSNFGMIVNH